MAVKDRNAVTVAIVYRCIIAQHCKPPVSELQWSQKQESE
jgi:hypothetical protein